MGYSEGIAFTKEKFRFIFDLETDVQMVLKQGFWIFDDWGMAMERWVGNATTKLPANSNDMSEVA